MEIMLLGFMRAAAAGLVQKLCAPALTVITGGAVSGVATSLQAWPQGLAGLKLQNDILRQLHDLDAVLPARAGTVFTSPNDVRDLITKYGNEIGTRLELVAGKVELGVEIWSAGGCTVHNPTLGPGREYLRRLGSTELDSSPVGVFCVQLHQNLMQMSTDSVRLTCLRPNTVFRAGYLVSKENIDEFRLFSTEKIGERSDLKIVITGPWPPYNFSCLELNRE